MKPGIYKNIPFAEYQKWEAVHKSMFSSLIKSGLQFKHFLEKGEEETKIMGFGNLVDCLLFEPELYDERYTITPETYPAIVKKEEIQKPWNWTANYCKEWREEKLSENPDIKIVSLNDIGLASDIVSSIKNHPEAQRYLKEAEYQVSLYWIDPETDLPCKARMDAYNGTRITDLKVTDDIRPSLFSKIIKRFKYHAGGAFYHDGLMHCMGIELEQEPSIPFSFIAAESDPPHDVVCYNLGPQSFEAGRIIYREALNRYKEFKESGEYPGYSNVSEEIEIPMYDLNKIQLDGVIE
jgi:hypothetical protein